jgi:hypothetical protein
MKINKITYGLIAAGMVSSASAAISHPTVTLGGNTYTEVFLTGSSAARANIFNAINTAHSGAAQPNGSGGVFDAAPTLVPATAGTGTSTYDAYGTINGVRYCLCLSFSGSEAGIAAVEHLGTGISNPVAANTLHGNPDYSDAVIPNTPDVSYLSPVDGTTKFTHAANLATADTSQAVSLTPSPALDDFGCVGAVTFVWVKGKNSAPDAAYNNLVNVTDPQMNVLLNAFQPANFLTGKVADSSDYALVCGRNRASGTHQNTMLDTQHGVNNASDQWVPSDCFYSNGTTPAGVPHGQLQNGATEGPTATLTALGGVTEIFNDGFESGGGVAKALECDEAGSQNIISQGSTLVNSPLILIGYLGISDAAGVVATQPNAVLTLNGNPLNDGNVINGAYSFWGHEHLYGEVGAKTDAVDAAIAKAIAGDKFDLTLSQAKATPPNGALESAGGLGGTVATAQSSIIKPDLMRVDKPSGGDGGYPALD